MWDDLVAILTEMLDSYKTLLEMSRSKRDILVTVKTKDLEALTKEEELLIIKLGKLENRRQTVLRDLADVYSLSHKDINLQVLQQLAESAVADRLQNLDHALTKVAGELVDLNRLNTQLIQQSLDYVNFNLNILAQNCADPTYQQKGQAGSSARIMFDAKV